jgi:RNA polymerase sigma factor (sigma-70 family)
VSSPATAPAAVRVEDHVALVHWYLRRRGHVQAGRRPPRSLSRRRSAPPTAAAVDYDDLFAAGCLGLLRAAKNFEPTRGFAFATYALWWVRHYVTREVENVASTVRYPVHYQAKCRAAGQSTRPTVHRLDLPIRGGDDETSTRLDVLPDEDAPLPDEDADARRAPARLAELMNRARLSPRQRFVLRMRAEHSETLGQVGKRIGLSRERIRQIERQAIMRLRVAAGVPADAPWTGLSEP